MSKQTSTAINIDNKVIDIYYWEDKFPYFYAIYKSWCLLVVTLQVKSCEFEGDYLFSFGFQYSFFPISSNGYILVSYHLLIICAAKIMKFVRNWMLVCELCTNGDI